MNWELLEKEIAALAKSITESIDCIVPIARGGLVPGRLLATKLQIKAMYALTVEKHDSERIVVTEITKELTGKKVLLVEDMLETGKSMLVVKRYLEKKGAIVVTACLYTMPITTFTPDYSLKQVSSIQSFPWE